MREYHVQRGAFQLVITQHNIMMVYFHSIHLALVSSPEGIIIFCGQVNSTECVCIAKFQGLSGGKNDESFVGLLIKRHHEVVHY